jgi:hypothetical protein
MINILWLILGILIGFLIYRRLWLRHGGGNGSFSTNTSHSVDSLAHRSNVVAIRKDSKQETEPEEGPSPGDT